MKHCFLALGLLLAGASAFAQQATPAPLTLPVDPKTHRIAYSGTIAVPGATKNELYARGKIWLAKAFPSIQRVVQDDNQQVGSLVGSGVSATNISYGLIPVSNRVEFRYTIKLSFEEGNYYYNLTDFQFESGQPQPFDPGLALVHHVLTDFQIDPQSGQFRGLTPLVEQTCLAKRSNGTPTHQAAKFSQGLDGVAQRMVSSIELGMRQAAGGGDW